MAMADDEDSEIEVTVDEDLVDDDLIEVDDVDDVGDVVDLDEEVKDVPDGGAKAADDADEDEDEDPEAKTRARPTEGDDTDEDDELDPDDVEADLDAILRDRIAADEDEAEEEDEGDVVVQPAVVPKKTAGVAQKREGEFMCEGCFMVVNPHQFGPPGDRQCPQGEDPCPSIELLEGS
jgi:hypothetical protein